MDESFGRARILVLDNGGGAIKAGLASDSEPTSFPNCTGSAKGERTLVVGEDVASCVGSGVTVNRGFERGYLIHWDVQKDVWDHAFKRYGWLPQEHVLSLTEPPLNFPELQAQLDEVVFEEYGFQGLFRSPAACHVLRQSLATLSTSDSGGMLDAAAACGAGIVVDTGFSFTHSIPIFNHRIVKNAVKRLDVGGKALTNYLKELISMRSVNVSDMFYVVDSCKQDVCHVCESGVEDALWQCAARGARAREYILPDGVERLRGYLKRPEDDEALRGMRDGAGHALQPPSPDELARRRRMEEATVELRSEPFMVPEVLFRPMDIGLNQHGVAGLIAASLAELPVELREVCLSNVVVCGGNANFPGFLQRLQKELQPLVPSGAKCSIRLGTPDAITCAWHGARIQANEHTFLTDFVVTKRQYEEEGHERVRSRLQAHSWWD